MIDKKGNWLYYGDIGLGNGAEKAKEYLRENPALAEELTKKILAKRGLLNMQQAPAAAAPVEEVKEETPAPTTNHRAKRVAAAAE